MSPALVPTNKDKFASLFLDHPPGLSMSVDKLAVGYTGVRPTCYF